MAGIWQQHQTFDGTYSFSDLMDAHEMLDLKQETEYRIREVVAASKTK